MDELKVFIPISKIDEEQRLVYGQMTAEAVDSAGEIWDYDGSKPYFEDQVAPAPRSDFMQPIPTRWPVMGQWECAFCTSLGHVHARRRRALRLFRRSTGASWMPWTSRLAACCAIPVRVTAAWRLM